MHNFKNAMHSKTLDNKNMLKSLLHSSSDIFKAINEAWQQSESPEVFTVKIIDPGKKGFLGFSHKPAIISFTYQQNQGQQIPSCQLKTVICDANSASQTDLSSLPEAKEIKKTHNHERNQLKTQNSRVQKKEDPSPQTNPKVEPTKQKNQQSPQPSQNQKAKTQTATPVEKPVPTKKAPKTSTEAENQEFGTWNDDLAGKAAIWIGGFFKNFGMIGSAKAVKIEDRLLTISVEKSSDKDSILPQLLADNLFVCACATLAVQSLRNSSSERLKGLRIKILSAEV